MASQYLYVLQSGFVTQATPELIKTSAPDRSPMDRLFVQDARVVDTDNYYDEGVEKLFQLIREDESRLNVFENRERILLTFYRLFGKKAFTDWVTLQYGQRTVGYLHYRFLDDTIVRANGWADRAMDNYTYYRLLSASETSRTTQNIKAAQNVLIDRIKGLYNIQPENMLVNWTPDTHGFMDLLHTLHVIFGKRSGAQSTTRRR